ncbi:MAG: asparagine synthase C-terminal domain-containing protein [Candidatus Micrarchaeota archaeon]
MDEFDEREMISRLSEALARSVEKNVAGARVGVMFSGGVDSTLLALLAKKFCAPVLFTVGTADSEDLRYSEIVACELGLPLEKKILSEKEVIDYAKEVEKMLGDRELMHVELGIPILLCCEMARSRNIRVLLNGQGAEELFGGYERHLQAFLSGEDASALMKGDLEKLPENDVKRSARIAQTVGVALRYPFLEKEIVSLAQQIPAHMHFSRPKGKKEFLRKVAHALGVPETARERRKRAAQYGSGVHRILLRESKRGARRTKRIC